MIERLPIEFVIIDEFRIDESSCLDILLQIFVFSVESIIILVTLGCTGDMYSLGERTTSQLYDL